MRRKLLAKNWTNKLGAKAFRTIRYASCHVVFNVQRSTSKTLKVQLHDPQVNKLLLLGAGESGKSTLFKQMITLYRSGFSEDERKWYTQIIYNNAITSMKVLCQHCDDFNGNPEMTDSIPCEAEEDKKFILDLNIDVEIDEVLAARIKKLWADPGIQYTYSKRATFQLLDSAQYFFDRLDVIGTPNYLPDEQDVLCSRVRTTGIVENNFKV